MAWHGATASGPEAGYDAQAHIAYASILGSEKRLPSEQETYEFATPPAYPALAVALQRVADGTGGHLPWPGGTAARAGWLAAVALAALLVLLGGRARWLGVGFAALAGLAALAAADAASHDVRWTAGQALSILWTAGFLVVAWLLGRELWPDRPLLAALAALVTAAIPIVVRLGTMFHPEMQFAFLAALGLLLAVRASRRGWPLRDGIAAGAALALAALTRPTAALVMVALGFAIVFVGGRPALRFSAAAAWTVVLLAGPWWGYQAARYGNPLESNLDRYELEGGQPRSFYVSAPVRDLVVHPYRPSFAGELWPQFHADLWSDWFGGQHGFWGKQPGTPTRAFLSAQSVLGFAFTLLALGGLVVLGLRGLRERDFPFAAFLVLALASWAAFVVQLVRFPQEGGDPIKSSYMLYLAPVFALAAVAAGQRLWGRGRGWRAALVAFGVLYAGSYAGFLVTSFPALPR